MIQDPPEFTEQQLLIAARMRWFNTGQLGPMPQLDDIKAELDERLARQEEIVAADAATQAAWEGGRPLPEAEAQEPASPAA